MMGPSTMAMANVTPKLTPINAIALVRFCSRVRSDSSAITAAAIAPEPCSARPRIMPQMESVGGGNHAAEHKDQQPADNQRLAADPVGEQAKRDLKHRLRQAVDADGEANQRLAGALERHTVRGQNRQDHKHAKHPQGEDSP